MEKTGIIKITILGAESTGKSTLCEQLAAHYKTTYAPEFARTYLENRVDKACTIWDLDEIAKRQLASEAKEAERAERFLFCDTGLITIKIWAELEFGTCPPFITDELAKSDVSFYIIMNNDVDWEPDPLRLSKHSRDLIFERNVHEVQKAGVPYTIVNGTGEKRLKQAAEAVDLFFG